MESAGWVETVLAFVRANETMIEVVLFLLAFGESVVLFSFFIPASVIFLAIGALHGASGGDLWPLILAGTAGAILGDIVSYWIGWRYRNDLQKMWPFRNHPEWLLNARKFIDRWGIPGVVAAKFVGPMRPLVPTISGAVAMPGGVFLAASAVSSLVWSIVFLVPTYYGVDLLMR
jgi:membrane protein DedA with SNARE-associated domain